MTPRELLAVLKATASDTTHADDASYGPDEPCIASSDLDWMADQAADRDERFRESA